MAVSFDFTGTSGTALETYDSRFKSLEAGAFIIASGYLLKASGRVWWDDWFVFKNGQTDAQEIEVVVGPRALSGEDVHVNLHLNIDGITDPADRIDGYRVEVYASVIRLSKNGTMIVQENHSESVTGVEHTVRIKHEGTSVRVWLNGNLYINATDSTPLTGGWPGGKIYSAGNQAGAGLNALTDYSAVSSGGVDGDAPGATFQPSIALTPGAAGGDANVGGQVFAPSLSLVGGDAYGSADAGGQAFAPSLSVITGDARGGAAATGRAVQPLAALTVGAAQGDGNAPGETFTANARLVVTSSESQDAHAPGATFGPSITLIPGAAHVERPLLLGAGVIYQQRKIKPKKREKPVRVDAAAPGAVFSVAPMLRAGRAAASAQASGAALVFRMRLRPGAVRASAKAPPFSTRISGIYLAPDGVNQHDHYMRLMTEDAVLLAQIR